MLNPTDAIPRLRKADKDRYKACQNRKIYELSNGQMVGQFKVIVHFQQFWRLHSCYTLKHL